MTNEQYEAEIKEYSLIVAELEAKLAEANGDLHAQDEEIAGLYSDMASLEMELDSVYAQRDYAAILATRAVASYGAAPYALGCGWYEKETNYYVVLEAPGGKTVNWCINRDNEHLVSFLREVEVPNLENAYSPFTEECIEVISYDPLEYRYTEIKNTLVDIFLEPGGNEECSTTYLHNRLILSSAIEGVKLIEMLDVLKRDFAESRPDIWRIK